MIAAENIPLADGIGRGLVVVIPQIHWGLKAKCTWMHLGLGASSSVASSGMISAEDGANSLSTNDMLLA